MIPRAGEVPPSHHPTPRSLGYCASASAVWAPAEGARWARDLGSAGRGERATRHFDQVRGVNSNFEFRNSHHAPQDRSFLDRSVHD
jgi:hypothetical protein